MRQGFGNQQKAISGAGGGTALKAMTTGSHKGNRRFDFREAKVFIFGGRDKRPWVRRTWGRVFGVTVGVTRAGFDPSTGEGSVGSGIGELGPRGRQVINLAGRQKKKKKNKNAASWAGAEKKPKKAGRNRKRPRAGGFRKKKSAKTKK